jgi:hypothetical protein
MKSKDDRFGKRFYKAHEFFLVFFIETELMLNHHHADGIRLVERIRKLLNANGWSVFRMYLISSG